MFIGKLFANMMLEKYPHITFFPSYGAEVRGGTSHCQIILSSDEIASPMVEQADLLILMNQPSADRFLPILREDGTAFVNSSMARAPDAENILLIPATELAHEIGDVRAANVVIFAACLRKQGIVTREEAMKHMLAVSARKGEKAAEINRTAFSRGWSIVNVQGD